MFDINSLKDAQKIAQEKRLQQGDHYYEVFETAVNFFHRFLQNNEVGTLKNATEKFAEAQRIKPSKPEPYFMLAVAFYYIGQNFVALKYLNALKAIDPNYPDLHNFYQLINKGMG